MARYATPLLEDVRQCAGFEREHEHSGSVGLSYTQSTQCEDTIPKARKSSVLGGQAALVQSNLHPCQLQATRIAFLRLTS